jgi:hypothetical protein
MRSGQRAKTAEIRHDEAFESAGESFLQHSRNFLTLHTGTDAPA